eukprot:7412669-Heterocapsa_arctica.AAC.1
MERVHPLVRPVIAVLLCTLFRARGSTTTLFALDVPATLAFALARALAFVLRDLLGGAMLQAIDLAGG